jgi:hypothetical protein
MTGWMWTLLLLSVERIPLAADGKFEARAGKNVRVLVERAAEIRVNGLYAGSTNRELDITGFLRAGVNEVKASSGGGAVLLVFSPPVYVQLAEMDGKTLRVTVVNTTEHTMQVELDGAHQFTVSPGTSREVSVAARAGAKTVRIRAASDGLDLAYEDEAEILVR